MTVEAGTKSEMDRRQRELEAVAEKEARKNAKEGKKKSKVSPN